MRKLILLAPFIMSCQQNKTTKYEEIKNYSFSSNLKFNEDSVVIPLDSLRGQFTLNEYNKNGDVVFSKLINISEYSDNPVKEVRITKNIYNSKFQLKKNKTSNWSSRGKYEIEHKYKYLNDKLFETYTKNSRNYKLKKAHQYNIQGFEIGDDIAEHSYTEYYDSTGKLKETRLHNVYSFNEFNPKDTARDDAISITEYKYKTDTLIQTLKYNPRGGFYIQEYTDYSYFQDGSYSKQWNLYYYPNGFGSGRYVVKRIVRYFDKNENLIELIEYGGYLNSEGNKFRKDKHEKYVYEYNEQNEWFRKVSFVVNGYINNKKTLLTPIELETRNINYY